MIKTKKMNGKDLTPEQLQGLDAGLTQGGNPSVLNPTDTTASGNSTKTDKIKKNLKDAMKQVKGEKPYNPYGKDATANPSNMSVTTGS